MAWVCVWGQDIPPETNTKITCMKSKHLRLCRTVGVHPGVQPPVREVIPRAFVYRPGAEANVAEPDADSLLCTTHLVCFRSRGAHKINLTMQFGTVMDVCPWIPIENHESNS